MGDLMSESMSRLAMRMRPFSRSSRRSEDVRNLSSASLYRPSVASISDREMRFPLKSSSWRVQSLLSFCMVTSASSMARRVSTYSIGVGLGEILNSGAPALTASPTLNRTSATMPGMVDLTLISFSGSIVPTARAFSRMSPRETATSLVSAFGLPQANRK